MGRHRWTSRLTVEDCPLCLCVASFRRAGFFACPIGTLASLTWTRPNNGEWLGRLDYRLDSGTEDPSDLAIYVRAQLAGIGVPVDEQTIPITTVRPHLGGKRFWLVCGCGRRAGRLYLPVGQRIFRCRHCHNLTYRSAQRHDHRNYLLARNLAEVVAASQAKGLRQMIGGRALMRQLEWRRQGRLALADRDQVIDSMIKTGKLEIGDLKFRLVSKSRGLDKTRRLSSGSGDANLTRSR